MESRHPKKAGNARSRQLKADAGQRLETDSGDDADYRIALGELHG